MIKATNLIDASIIALPYLLVQHLDSNSVAIPNNSIHLWMLSSGGLAMMLVRTFLWLRQEFWADSKGTAQTTNDTRLDEMIRLMSEQNMLLKQVSESVLYTKIILESFSRDLIDRIAERINSDARQRRENGH